jgi:hypothetical protein
MQVRFGEETRKFKGEAKGGDCSEWRLDPPMYAANSYALQQLGLTVGAGTEIFGRLRR